jgi:hypothetical protein
VVRTAVSLVRFVVAWFNCPLHTVIAAVAVVKAAVAVVTVPVLVVISLLFVVISPAIVVSLATAIS